MIKLSHSSIKNLYAGHEWLNKQMGIPIPDYPFLTEGKEAHAIIQKHLSGKEKSPLLAHIEMTFPVVEEKDFDDRCRFEFELPKTDPGILAHTKSPSNYLITGFYDGVDMINHRFLEIKTSSVLWSMKKFQESEQRKIYALSNPAFKEAILITSSRDPKDWENEKPKLFAIPITERDRREALNWILGGIEILEKGDFTGGLDKDGKCLGCFWNMSQYPELANCNFL